MATVERQLVSTQAMDLLITYDDADTLGTHTDGAVKHRLLSVTVDKKAATRVMGHFTCPPLAAITFESTSTANRTVTVTLPRYIGEFSYGFRQG